MLLLNRPQHNCQEREQIKPSKKPSIGGRLRVCGGSMGEESRWRLWHPRNSRDSEQLEQKLEEGFWEERKAPGGETGPWERAHLAEAKLCREPGQPGYQVWFGNLTGRAGECSSVDRVLPIRACAKPWVSSPAWHKLCRVANAHNPNTQEVEIEGSGVQTHLYLHTMFKDILGYKRIIK